MILGPVLGAIANYAVYAYFKLGAIFLELPTACYCCLLFSLPILLVLIPYLEEGLILLVP